MAACRNLERGMVLKSPLGNLHISYCGKGVHSLSLDSKVSDETFSPDPKQKVVVEEIENQTLPNTKELDSVRIACIAWLQCYFHSPSQLSGTVGPPLCLDAEGPAFSNKCLISLPDLAPFGKVVSYSDLAESAGNAKASRAAGGAMRTNPFMILVPCHRVITKSGAMGKFSGGTRQRVKEWLLQHEGHKRFTAKP